jgi:CBS domain containing-hemolysin-like protein
MLLVLVSGAVIQRSTMSSFELDRRSAVEDKAALAIKRREKLLDDVFSLQRITSALLLVLFVLISEVAFGWFFGIIIAAVVALEYGAIARIPPIRRYSQRLYERFEPSFLDFTERFAGVFRIVRNVTPEVSTTTHLESREELQHLVSQSGTLLSSDEKKLIAHGLLFENRKASEIMTPRGVIDSISKKELLGPLVLDDLHKTGHSRFPVIDGDVDHVVGMLHVQNLLTLDAKRSTTAEKAMEARVFYIREDQTLQHALAAFLRTHHHLFVVVNEFRETVGILSLEDVIEALLGRKIVDEFDMHDDLRVVAMRNPRGNNRPEKREDV